MAFFHRWGGNNKKRISRLFLAVIISIKKFSPFFLSGFFIYGAANVMERGCKALTLDPTTKGVARIRFRSLKTSCKTAKTKVKRDIYKGKK